jgi:uncharacterized protein
MAEFLDRAACRHATSLLILQPTAFCNINCEYCYLPNRDDRHVMSLDLVRAAVDFIFTEQLNGPDLTVVWHAGEPLVVNPDWYRRAFGAVAEAAPQDIVLPHAVQTNGMLIDDKWCDLFLEFGVRVSVSLDGPAELHDARRKTRSGGGTHARVMRGIELLQKRKVPFSALCVVGAKTLPLADKLMDFFRANGICEVGFNIEEIENPSNSSTLQQPGSDRLFRRFFAQVLESAFSGQPLITIREQQNLLSCLEHPAFGRMFFNSQVAPFGIVTVSSRGELFTFSPELAGLKNDRFADFAVGRLPGAKLDQILRSQPFHDMWSEIGAGARECRNTCEYFDLCLGGAPINKIAENGSFASTETMFCRFSQKIVADVVLSDLERRLAADSARKIFRYS